ncbi:MAG: YcaO-like family protein [Parcubacteria group bacterium]|nr:YcaO-like family protein [Parcubacteria group bacterium]
MLRFLSFLLSPHDAESLSVLVGSRFPRYALSLFGRIVGMLERTFGVRLGVVVPPHFDRDAPDRWRFEERFRTLKASGIATSFRFQKYGYPDEPRGFITHIDISGAEEKQLGYSGAGLDIFDRNKTFLPALGEAVERWALNTVPAQKTLKRSSFGALGDAALDIFSFAGFSDEQRRKGHPRFHLSFTKDTPFAWTRGFSLTQKKPLWLPLQLVSLKYAHDLPAPQKEEPLLAPIISTGAAAGPDLASAILNGILEVIERDAFMVYWLNSLAPERIDIATIPDERFKKMRTIAERYNLEAYLMDLRTDTPVHTLCAVLLDRTGIGPGVVLSSATSADFKEAAYKSLSNALTARAARRKLYDIYRDIVPEKAEDLRYRSRLVFWCMPEHISRIEFFLAGAVKTYDELTWAHPFRTHGTPHRDLTHLMQFFFKEKYEVAYAEILPEALKRRTGMCVVSVKIPAFQPVYLDESLPAFSGARLREVPSKIGRKPAERVNTFPHPFP